ISSSPPLLLDGPGRVTSWMPSVLPAADEEFLARVKRLYEKDTVLSAALEQALATQATAAAAMHDAGDLIPGNALQKRNGGGAAAGYGAVAPLMEGAGRILGHDRGPR